MHHTLNCGLNRLVYILTTKLLSYVFQSFILIQAGKQRFSLTSFSSESLFKRKGKAQCEMILTLENDVKLLMLPDFFRVASLQRAKIQPFDFHVNHSL